MDDNKNVTDILKSQLERFGFYVFEGDDGPLDDQSFTESFQRLIDAYNQEGQTRSSRTLSSEAVNPANIPR